MSPEAERPDWGPLTMPAAKPLSTLWVDAKPNEIGAGFKPTSKRSQRILMQRSADSHAVREAERFASMSRSEQLALVAQKVSKQERLKPNASGVSKFLTGNNRFIFYMITVNMEKIKAKAMAKKRKPPTVNYANPLSKRQKQRFAESLKANIDSTADFLWKDLLPVTNSLLSALDKVDDYSQQAIEGKAEVDAAFLKRKMMDAVHLRMIRHICEKFGLNKEERQHMVAEFRLRAKIF